VCYILDKSYAGAHRVREKIILSTDYTRKER
jgi:hypothetical protein